MLNESTADSLAIKGTFLLGFQGACQGPSISPANLVSLAVNRSLEQRSLFRGNHWPGLPEFIGCRSVGSFGPGGGIGLSLGGGHIVGGPESRSAMLGGELFGPRFQRPDAGFDGTIVPWTAGW